jgi:hypothetical protein
MKVQPRAHHGTNPPRVDKHENPSEVVGKKAQEVENDGNVDEMGMNNSILDN